MKKFIEDWAGDPLLDRPAEGLFYLPQNLGFPDDHGIQAGADPEEVPDSLVSLVDIKERFELIRADSPDLGQKIHKARS